MITVTVTRPAGLVFKPHKLASLGVNLKHNARAVPLGRARGPGPAGGYPELEANLNGLSRTVTVTD